MPLQIVHRDITKMACDVIVVPTDPGYSGGGGTDLTVHRAAGPMLDTACRKLKPLCTGEVAVTDAYELPCRFIIHTVGPVWQGGGENESVLLRSCYLNALMKAQALGAGSVAFPLISSGTFGFPKRKVLSVALRAISDHLRTVGEEPEVYLCVYDKGSYELDEKSALEHWLQRNRIDDECLFSDAFCTSASAPEVRAPAPQPKARDKRVVSESCAPPGLGDLESWIKQHDDSFAVTLMKLIDKKGMTDVQCYKKANVSKGTFWKINNDPAYRPSKQTVIAFAIALELSLDETEQLLRTVGFSLSHSSTFDLIIEFYIRRGIYDVFEINSALYQYDQVCLGC